MNSNKPNKQGEGPNPAEFPLGSPESRAAARLLAGEEVINCITIHSNTRKALQLRSTLPPERNPPEPIGQTMFEGKPYEVYNASYENKLELFLKCDNSPLPETHFPNAIVILRCEHVGL